MKPVVVSEIPNAKEELKTYLRLTGLDVRGRKPFYFCLFCFVFQISCFAGSIRGCSNAKGGN
jgi:hypothetical protein